MKKYLFNYLIKILLMSIIIVLYRYRLQHRYIIIKKTNFIFWVIIYFLKLYSNFFLLHLSENPNDLKYNKSINVNMFKIPTHTSMQPTIPRRAWFFLHRQTLEIHADLWGYVLGCVWVCEHSCTPVHLAKCLIIPCVNVA